MAMIECSGWRVAHWGGNLNNGSKAGLCYANVNNSSGDANSNIGARLRLVTMYIIATSPLGEKHKMFQSELVISDESPANDQTNETN